MSDQVAYLDDLLLEDSLEEVFHGGPSPELAERILKVAGSPVREPAAQDPTPAPTRAEGVNLRAVPLDPDAPLSLPRWAIWLAQGAVAAGLAILLVVLVFPREPEAPEGVIAAQDAEFEYDPAVEWPEIQAEAGWYLLSDGAPPLTAAESRVEDVKGTVIVKVGDIPNPDELAAQQPWLAQHQVEAQMNGNWIKAGALALCIVSGSAFVDGQYLSAQDVREKNRKESDRKDGDRKEAERKESDRRDAEVKKDDEAARKERAAAELEKLREEIADLEERLAEARELENEKERKARVERIEKALKDKRERVAEIEARIAGDDKKRDDDAAARKRREAERRKNAEKDDDAAAKDRREAERRKKEDAGEADRKREEDRRKDAESDDDRRKREEEAARKKREGDRREKERKDERKQ